MNERMKKSDEIIYEYGNVSINKWMNEKKEPSWVRR